MGPLQGQLKATEAEASDVVSEEAAAASAASYDYLLGMAISSLTVEKVGALVSWTLPHRGACRHQPAECS